MEFRLQKKTYIMLVFMIVTLVVVGCTTEQQAQDTENQGEIINQVPAEDNPNAEETQVTEEVVQKETGSQNIVTFVLTGENFFFKMDGEKNPELRVKKGDTVKIEFTSTDGFHNWVVDEFDAATERVQTGGTTRIEFVADKKGTFEYYCSVGSHRTQGMFGSLVVE
ncbi:MAG: multicopper oxidase domain-containing protein [Nanoarchaeota archaeon]